MDDEFRIERAKRSQALARLAISAVSGAGKTMGALRVAKGIVEYMLEAGVITGTIEGKIGVVDTERRSAQLYSHVVPFDTIVLTPPYTTERYVRALRSLERAGCVVCIIDQISHAWAGEGGMLEKVDIARAANRNQMDAWKDATPEQNRFVEDLLACRAHLICTMRAKTQYVMEEATNSRGQRTTKPKKIGLAPVQRAGIEYEFTTLLELDLESHLASASKDRTSLFMGKRVMLNEEVGRSLAQWLLAGDQADPAAGPEPTSFERARAITDARLRMMASAANLPDLARIFTEGRRELGGFQSTVDLGDLEAMLAELEAAGAARKRALGGAPAPRANGTEIPIEDADALEQLLLAATVVRDEFLAEWGIATIRALPAEKLGAAIAWIGGRAHAREVDVALPARFVGRFPAFPPLVRKPVKAGGGGHFDDMEDDIPF